MKTNRFFLIAGMLLTTLGTGLSQPCSITITREPQSQANCIGTTATTWVTADGTAPLSYQWQRSGDQVSWVDVPEATHTNYVILNFQAADVAYYRVVVTNAECSVASQTALLSPLWPAGFTSNGQPTNWPVVSPGANLTNRALATGSGPLSYQWRVNGTDLPGQTKNTIILTNLQMTNEGSCEVVLANACGSVTSRVVRLTVDPTFIKITRGPVVEDRESSVTATAIDVDDDGKLDLWVANGGSGARQSLYRNLGGDEFIRVTNALTTGFPGSWGANWADVDNDGDLDVLINHYGVGYPNWNAARNEMFRNDGNWVFTPMNNAATATSAFWTDAVWVDHNRDGWVDLFLTTQSLVQGQSLDDYFFQNLGDGRFAAWTTSVVGMVLKPQSATAGPVFCDIDGDGDLDLYVSNFGGATNFLYRNDGGKLISVRAGSLPARQSTYAAAWADFNNDGLFDLFTGSANGTNMLHFNRGNWVFEDVSVASGVAMAGRVFNAAVGDFDNDGDLDLFVPVYDGPDVLFVNRGDGTFDRVDVGSPLTEGSRNSALWVDYNNDGFLDLFLTCGDGVFIPNLLYRNNLTQCGNSNHYLNVKLNGVASNTSAIGALVSVSAKIGGKTVQQVRQISAAGISSVAQGLLAHFGLGDAVNVDLVRIEWPSGIVQQLTNVSSGQILTVTEHQEGATTSPVMAVSKSGDGKVQLSVTGQTNLLYVFEASADLVQWTKIAVRTNLSGTVEFTPPTSSAPAQFYRVLMP